MNDKMKYLDEAGYFQSGFNLVTSMRDIADHIEGCFALTDEVFAGKALRKAVANLRVGADTLEELRKKAAP